MSRCSRVVTWFYRLVGWHRWVIIHDHATDTDNRQNPLKCSICGVVVRYAKTDYEYVNFIRHALKVEGTDDFDLMAWDRPTKSYRHIIRCRDEIVRQVLLS